MNNWLLTKEQQEINNALFNGEDVTELIEKFEGNKIKYVVDLANVLENLEMLFTGISEKIKEVSDKKKKIGEQIERAKSVLVKAIKDYGQDGKILYNGIEFAVKKNPPKLIVTDENLIPDSYKYATIKVRYSDLANLEFNGIGYEVKSVDVDKDTIKKMNKTGIGVAGTEVLQEESLKR